MKQRRTHIFAQIINTKKTQLITHHSSYIFGRIVGKEHTSFISVNPVSRMHTKRAKQAIYRIRTLNVCSTEK